LPESEPPAQPTSRAPAAAPAIAKSSARPVIRVFLTFPVPRAQLQRAMSLSRSHLVARVTLALAVGLVCALGARPAAAAGAFPASAGVLVPAGRPHAVTLATNFGVIKSEDDGATWTWSCEQDPNGSRDLYQYGAATKLRLFARDATGLVFTDDG